MSRDNSLLVYLSDGQAHHCREMADEMSIERDSLIRDLSRLQAAGLNLIFSGNEICWIKPVPVLDKVRIFDAIGSISEGLTMTVVDQVDSTNRRVREHFSHGKIYLAEAQLSGRGRRGRHWVSPPFSNIYLSLGWRFSVPVSALSGLSLAIGILVVKALQPFVKESISVKWPNDIYMADQKLGGILLESVPGGNGYSDIVMGIGINVHMKNSEQGLDQPWISLSQVTDGLDRNELVIAVLKQLLRLLPAAPENIGEYIGTHWSDLDLTKGRPVMVTRDDQVTEGVGGGIDEQFNYVLCKEDGQLESFCSADVSLRLR